MRQIRIGWLLACALIVMLGVTACGPSQEEEMAAAAQEKFDAVLQLKDDLEAKRAELAAATEKAAMMEETAEGEGGEGEGEEGGEEGAEEAVDLGALGEEVENMANDLVSAIVDFINSDPPIEGEPLTEHQLAVIRMKSAEDMLLAQEYIDKGGDYRRAIRIYTDALNVDPDNPDLQAALASAEEARYVSPERFAEVKKGMTQEEVKAILGQVNLRNIREFERGVVGWFYPTADDGSAAGIFFRKRGDTYTAYDVKYEAIKGGPQEVG